MKKLLFVVVSYAISWAAFGADSAPALQWVKIIGGSGNNSVAAATGDHSGNLYIIGSTTSLDFPAVSATQTAPGGSPLTRIDLATGSASRLFPANLNNITSAASDPALPGTLYAASGSQIQKSVDAGLTWTGLFEFPSTADVFSLAVDPTISTTLYAATSTIGVQKSIDGGLTWVAINDGIPPQPNGSLSVQSVWVDPSASSVIFASGSFGLLRSADAGNAWAPVASGSAFSPLAFDPQAAGTLYFGSGNDILRSTDDGGTFVRISSLPDQAGATALVVDPHHAGLLYAASTGGIYRSSDAGGTWTLTLAGIVTVLIADPNSDAFYANASAGVVRTTDGFITVSPVGISLPSVVQLVLSGPNLFAVSTPTTEVFAVKLDGDGNIVYSTYFGGSGSDQAVALALGSDGSLYITGSTNSADLPVTTGAYLSTLPLTSKAAVGFVFKLDPRGALEWATYFPESSITSIAVDLTGDPAIAGSTGGGLPTTPGAYNTDFQQIVISNGFFSVPGPTSAFVTRFNSQGTGLIYSTYVPTDDHQNTVEEAGALAMDAAGNAWIGVRMNSTIAPAAGTPPTIVELNPAGSAVVASAVQAGLGNVAAISFDTDSNVYVAGSYAAQAIAFPATPRAFQSAPQPAVPVLPYQPPSGGGLDAFVAKWDGSLTHLLAATLLGGELSDTATSIAVDGSGTVIIGGYTDSKALPTHAPFQESFSSRSGFVAGFDANLSNLRFSTFLGDGRPFAAYGVVPDDNGNVLLAGSTLSLGATFANGNTGVSAAGSLAIANKISLIPAPPVRLDSVQNYASHIAASLAPGEPILALGSGFGNASQIVVDGMPADTISSTDMSIVAVLPDTAITSGVHTIQVSNNGTLSNQVYVPAAATSPGIYMVDGSGVGQSYVLNGDGTLNSPANPAPTGSAITIFVAGAGLYSVTDGYAVTPQPPAVFIDGFYCNGIAAIVGPVDGLPGKVYQLSVFLPDPVALSQNNPDLKNFKFPPQSSIQIWMGPSDSVMLSQTGVFVNVE